MISCSVGLSSLMLGEQLYSHILKSEVIHESSAFISMRASPLVSHARCLYQLSNLCELFVIPSIKRHYCSLTLPSRYSSV